MVPTCPDCGERLNLVTGTHQEIDEHFKDEDGKYDGTIPWYRPYSRDQREMFCVFSCRDDKTKGKHKSCWDCEWIVLAGQFNRMCVKHPKHFIRSGWIEDEIEEEKFLGHEGTVADQCPDFQVAKELQDVLDQGRKA